MRRRRRTTVINVDVNTVVTVGAAGDRMSITIADVIVAFATRQVAGDVAAALAHAATHLGVGVDPDHPAVADPPTHHLRVVR